MSAIICVQWCNCVSRMISGGAKRILSLCVGFASKPLSASRKHIASASNSSCISIALSKPEIKLYSMQPAISCTFSAYVLDDFFWQLVQLLAQLLTLSHRVLEHITPVQVFAFFEQSLQCRCGNGTRKRIPAIRRTMLPWLS